MYLNWNEQTSCSEALKSFLRKDVLFFDQNDATNSSLFTTKNPTDKKLSLRKIIFRTAFGIGDCERIVNEIEYKAGLKSLPGDDLIVCERRHVMSDLFSPIVRLIMKVMMVRQNYLLSLIIILKRLIDD